MAPSQRTPALALTGGPGRGGRRTARWQPKKKLLRRYLLRPAEEREARRGARRLPTPASPGNAAASSPPPRPGPAAAPPAPARRVLKRQRQQAAARGARRLHPPTPVSLYTHPSLPGMRGAARGAPRRRRSGPARCEIFNAPWAAARRRSRSGRAAAGPTLRGIAGHRSVVRRRRGHAAFCGERSLLRGAFVEVCLVKFWKRRVSLSLVLSSFRDRFSPGGEGSRFLCTETTVGVWSRRTDRLARAEMRRQCAFHSKKSAKKQHCQDLPTFSDANLASLLAVGVQSKHKRAAKLSSASGA